MRCFATTGVTCPWPRTTPSVNTTVMQRIRFLIRQSPVAIFCALAPAKCIAAACERSDTRSRNFFDFLSRATVLQPLGSSFSIALSQALALPIVHPHQPCPNYQFQFPLSTRANTPARRNSLLFIAVLPNLAASRRDFQNRGPFYCRNVAKKGTFLMSRDIQIAEPAALDAAHLRSQRLDDTTLLTSWSYGTRNHAAPTLPKRASGRRPESSRVACCGPAAKSLSGFCNTEEGGW
jgi:hypothetical protein